MNWPDVVPPTAEESERVVLGAILLDNSYLAKASEFIDAQDLYLEDHRHIFTSMLKLQSKRIPIDTLTLKNELIQDGNNHGFEITAYLASLTEGMPSAMNVAHYAQIIREKRLLRDVMRLGNQLVVNAAEPEAESQALMDSAQEELIRLYPRKSGGYQPMEDVARNGFLELEERCRSGIVAGAIRTGLKDIDAVIGGLRKQQLIVVAARPGNGKSALVHGIAVDAALRQGKRVAISSLEMSKQEIYDRMVSAEARVDLSHLAQGRIGRQDWNAISRSTAELSSAPIVIDDTGSLTIAQLHAKVRRLAMERGLDMLVVDYLQLMSGNRRSDSRAAEVSEISKGLKIIAKDLEIPVLAVSQLNRSSEIRGDKPRLSELRESGSIEQDADVVILLWREDRDKNIVEANVAKQRSGPVKTVNLAFIAHFTRFENFCRESGSPY